MSTVPFVAFHNVTFRYESAAEPLFRNLNVAFPRGFTGVVGANGAGKTTLLQIATGRLQPESGSIEMPGEAIYCAQRTDDPPARLDELLDDNDGETWALRGRLGIEFDFLDRWQTLSHGERKRAQIATALWQRPDILAIDEPTNHIDRDARDQLLEALRHFRGTGLIVSHDRDLLDELCSQCLWVEPPNARVFTGGFSKAAGQRAGDHATAQREREKALGERDRLHREQVKRRETASRSHIERSKRGIPIKDHDARFKKNIARLSGKDGQAGRLLKQMGGRVEEASAKAEAARVEKVHETGIWLPGSVSKRPILFHMDAGQSAMGDYRAVHFPTLTVLPTERIGITGANGLGKSTLVATVLAGINLAPENLIAIPQEIDRVTSQAILESARTLPKEQLGHVMTVVSRLGSRPQRLLDSHEPSPGEIRKLMLALGMARSPHLIVMDEPTNHLDLPSIEALEEALAECPCALMLVSHDQRFLDRLVTRFWHLEGEPGGDSKVLVS